MTATAAQLLRGPGECCRCHHHATERVLIGISDSGSGPGWSAFGCLPCARTYARSPLAPPWLAENLAVIDADRQGLRLVRPAGETDR